MLVSFPMDDATEKRSNCSYATSERAQHEGLFGTGDFSRDFSGENVSLSKCHCSDQITSIGVPLGELNGQWSPFGIECAASRGWGSPMQWARTRRMVLESPH